MSDKPPGFQRDSAGHSMEQLGRHDDARRDFAYVRDIWRRADPKRQPYVERP